MKKVSIGGLDLWQFDTMSKEVSIKHFVTDRSSYPSEKEFTLSYSSSPDRDEIQRNRNLLAAAIGVDSSHLFFPSQVHKTKVVRVTPETPRDAVSETDALISNAKGICIAVMSADCTPILLYDKRNNAVAAVHSGWRGTVARILEKTLHQMANTFGTKGEDVFAAIGPSVCQQSYEVGEEVIESVHASFGKQSGLLIAQPNNKARLDLRQANKLQLLEFGVLPLRIEVSDLCTVIHNNHFFSARKGDTGRFAAGIMLV
jgi:YfiH family protein